MRESAKEWAARLCVYVGVDSLWRYLNRNKLLVVMYHGVTRNHYVPPVWTQLPEKIFRQQIEFLATHYRPVSLGQVVRAISEGTSLPERAVLITFDDGLRNNFSIAYPILKEFQVPAVIFLTVDFIDTERFLWVDELFLYLAEAVKRQLPLPFDEFPEAAQHLSTGKLWEAYFELVESWKRLPDKQRTSYLSELAEAVPFDRQRFAEDFGLLAWEQVLSMGKEGLIDYGVHTATHTILTCATEDELTREVIGAKDTLEERLGRSISVFCYPNGREGQDFTRAHEKILASAGYVCSFATNSRFFQPRTDNPFAIGRLPAGNDTTSEPFFFRINASGFATWIKGCFS